MNIEDAKFIETKMRLLSKEQEAGYLTVQRLMRSLELCLSIAKAISERGEKMGFN